MGEGETIPLCPVPYGVKKDKVYVRGKRLPTLRSVGNSRSSFMWVAYCGKDCLRKDSSQVTR